MEKTKHSEVIPYHLYLGCEVKYHFEERGILVGVSASEYEKGKTIAIINVGIDDFQEWYIEETTLVLRKLDSMTEEDCRELRIDSPRDLEGNLGNLILTQNDFAYLLSKGYDLFQLIEKGLAIDSSSLSTKPEIIE